MNKLDTPQAAAEAYDVIVVGSGAGGLSAALSASLAGLGVIVLEKFDRIGGTTARSGGGAWLPGNPLAAEEGIIDDPADARRYVEAVVGNHFDAERIDAFLEHAPKMMREFRERSEVDFIVARKNPDYHPDLPGAGFGGRTCYAKPYDGTRLGASLERLRGALPELTLGGMYIGSGIELAHFAKGIRSLPSTLFVIRRFAAHFFDVVRHGRATRLTNGAALVARLTKSLLDRKVEIRTSAPVRRLVTGANGVSGVVVEIGGRQQVLTARLGVVMAAGGFPHDAERRGAVYPAGEQARRFVTPTPAENTGDGIDMVEAVGGRLALDIPDVASWCPVSAVPRKDGSTGAFPHFMDRQKPGVIAVTRHGVRFCNEADSYHDFVKSMMTACEGEDEIAAYLIADDRSLRRYGLGDVKPFPLPIGSHLKSGYLKRGRTIEELAAAIGIDPAALSQTVARYNAGAVSGRDPEFHRGENAYNRYLGDPEHMPNPCVAPIADGPFYAIKLVRGEIGTFAGIATNGNAEVLGGDGQPVGGLYACGNDMSSIFAGDYVGGGATLGPALTFGYIAGKHLAGRAAL
jgi:succinate dehydrogenase/fumarate reductase flavoprotein subunit